jgi:hypothetical protein
MDTGIFKRNVFRTVLVKTAKVGLRDTARTSPTTNLFHGIIGFNTEVGGLLQGLNPYLLGEQLNDTLLQNTFTSLGGVSYYTVMLAKTLKVKIPGSGKKVHLKHYTKTEALLKLNSLSVELLYQAMGVFNGGVWDTEAIKMVIDQVIEVLWPLTYDLLAVTPSVVFESYSARLEAGYPTGLFSADKDAYKVAAEQLKAMEAAALAEKHAKTAPVVEDAAAEHAES